MIRYRMRPRGVRRVIFSYVNAQIRRIDLLIIVLRLAQIVPVFVPVALVVLALL